MGSLSRSVALAASFFAIGFLFSQTWEVFDMSTAGLPSQTVLDIAEDGSNNIWLATDYGLCKFDGSVWTIYQTFNSGLPDNQINTLDVDSLDRIWIGMVQGGLAIFDGNATWEYFTPLNSPLPAAEVKCVTIDHRGWVWIGTYLGVACYTGTEWRVYDDTPSSFGGLLLNGTVIEDIQVRPDGLVAIATLNGGFHYLTDTLVAVHATYIDMFFDNTQLGAAFDTVNNECWLATPSAGLVRNFGDWNGGFWFNYDLGNSLIPTNSLTSIVMDAYGRPWVGSVDAGVLMRDPNDEFVAYNTTNSGIPDNSVANLLFANDDALWVGTYSAGAARMIISAGIADPSVPNELRAYPNPCGERCFIDVPFSTDGRTHWLLTDPQGRYISRGALIMDGRLEIDMSGLDSGVYLMEIVGSQGRATTKIIKS